MKEKVFELDELSLVDLFGVNEKNLKFLSILYPKLQLIQRGNTLKILGSIKDIEEFEKMFGLLLSEFERVGQMNEKIIMSIVKPGEIETRKSPQKTDTDVLVHGRNGLLVKAQTPSQKLMITEIEKNDMLFAIGPAGSGKTYTAVALAVRALKQKQV